MCERRSFAADIEEAADGKSILAVVIGDPEYMGSNYKKVPPEVFGQVLDWHTARALLDYSYRAGLGCFGCHPVVAWTESHVLVVDEYDGSVSVEAVPRNPVPCTPRYS